MNYTRFYSGSKGDGMGQASTDYGRAWLYFLGRFCEGENFYRKKIADHVHEIERAYKGTDELVAARDRAIAAIEALFNSATLMQPLGRPDLRDEAEIAIRYFDELLAVAEETDDGVQVFPNPKKPR